VGAAVRVWGVPPAGARGKAFAQKDSPSEADDDLPEMARLHCLVGFPSLMHILL